MDDLRLQEIKLTHFRNYEMFHVKHLSSLTIFVGPNAIGKTNIVEGIQLITALSSFRSSKVDELIKWGKGTGSVTGKVVSDSRDLDIELTLKNNQRTYALNGKHKTVSELQGLLPAVVFSPEDLALVKGSQSHRRSVLDLLGCQLSKNHRIIKRDYEKLIRHKNVLLKQHADTLLLESVNEMLIQTGIQMYRYRVALFENMLTRIQESYSDITHGEEIIGLSYIPSWESGGIKLQATEHPYMPSADIETVEALYRKALNDRAEEERIRQRCVVGPHADKIEFFINGKNAGSYASQGQQRSIVLAWKVAEVGIIRELLGVKPVLLLDDVMSELDAARRSAMVSLLFKDIQTFVTTTDVSFFDADIRDRADIIELGAEGNEIRS